MAHCCDVLNCTGMWWPVAHRQFLVVFDQMSDVHPIQVSGDGLKGVFSLLNFVFCSKNGAVPAPGF